MRTSLLVLGSIAALSVGCESTPMMSVVRVRAGDFVEPVPGDAVKLRRRPQERYAGVRGGFFVVRTTEDWRALWSGATKEPARPKALDSMRSMLLLAVSDSKWTQEIKVQRVVDTGTIVDVWVRETRVGEGCGPRALADATDVVVVDRIDKPVRFLVVEQSGEACGDPPVAQVRCRIQGSVTWSTELTAQPGDPIDCEMTAQSMGRFVLVDRVLSLSDSPGGSAAKLAFTKVPTRATFTVDVFGAYAVRGEAIDEADRKGAAGARVVASPPKTRDVVAELVWSGFDANDDPETFPRVTLSAREDGPKRRDCNAESPAPGFCEAKKRGAYTHMKLAAGDGGFVPLTVRYRDERVDKGPFACVKLWYDGQRTAETCDRKHRDADDTWDVGYVDLATGKLTESPPVPSVPGTRDGGVPPAAPNGAK